MNVALLNVVGVSEETKFARVDLIYNGMGPNMHSYRVQVFSTVGELDEHRRSLAGVRCDGFEVFSGEIVPGDRNAILLDAADVRDMSIESVYHSNTHRGQIVNALIAVVDSVTDHHCCAAGHCPDNHETRHCPLCERGRMASMKE